MLLDSFASYVFLGKSCKNINQCVVNINSQFYDLFASLEREERKREKTRKKETLWEAKMDETSEETPLCTENTWLPLNQANVSEIL